MALSFLLGFAALAGACATQGDAAQYASDVSRAATAAPVLPWEQPSPDEHSQTSPDAQQDGEGPDGTSAGGAAGPSQDQTDDSGAASGNGAAEDAGQGFDFEGVMLEAISSHHSNVEFPREERVGRQQVERFMNELGSSHPEVFWLKSSTPYTMQSVTGQAGMYLTGVTDLEYLYDPQQTARMKSELDAAIDQAVASLGSKADKAAYAAAAHDYLVRTCEYNRTVAEGGEDEHAHNAYAALVAGNPVCDGYAEAYALLLQQAGIPCKVVSSERMNHAWNMVQLDGAWYHVDVTHDDPVIRNEFGQIVESADDVSREHFLKSDATMGSLGYSGWDSDVQAPRDF